MGWGIRINWGHVNLWLTYGVAWLAFVGFALVAGWHLKPRLDEVVVVVLLPLGVLVPYAVLCFLVAALKPLRPLRNRHVKPPERVDVVVAGGDARLSSNKRIR